MSDQTCRLKQTTSYISGPVMSLRRAYADVLRTCKTLSIWQKLCINCFFYVVCLVSIFALVHPFLIFLNQSGFVNIYSLQREIVQGPLGDIYSFIFSVFLDEIFLIIFFLPLLFSKVINRWFFLLLLLLNEPLVTLLEILWVSIHS